MRDQIVTPRAIGAGIGVGGRLGYKVRLGLWALRVGRIVPM
ncbi:hypothetical protein AruPA_00630 [Acidiphilium sp. PA]|nr:hypothetical protein [Acidiphilium sp. PA]MCW8305527.1 hypothetical protein [Acidiphilium sp. PA]